MFASCVHHVCIMRLLTQPPRLQMLISLVKTFFKTVTAIKTAQRGIVLNAVVA
ncbi:hypothetical protein N9I04_00025 [Alphaproteobacteria bacterium]|nr:hypothetical protein [Alphaproteobacteria bacterium]